ncbi:hypothetical protein E2C01_079167 [Portunus trituberculatus]|uniref:Uncharacterized protein n=1 Tax=Portunus trituberculatus TaxID=210409 RepID=A0A5B7IQR1_PORTR|nr:hypothetical protein [Portunus trituberculatus]
MRHGHSKLVPLLGRRRTTSRPVWHGGAQKIVKPEVGDRRPAWGPVAQQTSLPVVYRHRRLHDVHYYTILSSVTTSEIPRLRQAPTPQERRYNFALFTSKICTTTGMHWAGRKVRRGGEGLAKGK